MDLTNDQALHSISQIIFCHFIQSSKDTQPVEWVFPEHSEYWA